MCRYGSPAVMQIALSPTARNQTTRAGLQAWPTAFVAARRSCLGATEAVSLIKFQLLTFTFVD